MIEHVCLCTIIFFSHNNAELENHLARPVTIGKSIDEVFPFMILFPWDIFSP